MKTPKILFVFVLHFLAFIANGQVRDTLKIPLETLVEVQLNALTYDLKLTDSQRATIFDLLKSKEKKQLQDSEYEDALLEVFTFDQRDAYLRLKEQDTVDLSSSGKSVGLMRSNTPSADKTVTINHVDIIDVRLVENQHSDGSHSENTNYSSYKKVAMQAWTYKGSKMFNRSLMKFDLTTIPVGSEIVSATLYLYSDPAVSSGASNGNSGSNAFYVERVTGSWDETGVTWNNQPSTTTSGRKLVGSSTSSTDDRQIDLKDMVQYWVNSPSNNRGVRFKLQTEVQYASRYYCSTEFSTISKRPRLVVKYNDLREKNIEYAYDNAGNRISREVIILSRSSNLKSANVASESANSFDDGSDVLNEGMDLSFFDYKVFPNPTKGNLHMRFTRNVTSEIVYTVHSLSGKQVLAGTITSGVSYEIPMNNLPKGVYLLTVNQSGESKTYKIIKQ